MQSGLISLICKLFPLVLTGLLQIVVTFFYVLSDLKNALLLNEPDVALVY